MHCVPDAGDNLRAIDWQLGDVRAGHSRPRGTQTDAAPPRDSPGAQSHRPVQEVSVETGPLHTDQTTWSRAAMQRRNPSVAGGHLDPYAALISREDVTGDRALYDRLRDRDALCRPGAD